MAESTLTPVKIYWPAVKQSDIGPIEDYSITIPAEISGILEVYKVPVCEAYPEGIWASITTKTSDKDTIEPGCEAHLKTHLLRVRLSGVPSSSSGDTMGMGMGYNEILYQHPDLPVNNSQLNPNVWDTPEVTPAPEGV